MARLIFTVLCGAGAAFLLYALHQFRSENLRLRGETRRASGSVVAEEAELEDCTANRAFRVRACAPAKLFIVPLEDPDGIDGMESCAGLSSRKLANPQEARHPDGKPDTEEEEG